MKPFSLLLIFAVLGLYLSCKLEKVDDIDNNCPNPPSAAFQTDVNSGGAPLTVQFTNNSTDAVSFEWNFGDNSAKVTTEDPQHIFSGLGTFTVKLIATSASGCKDTAVATITTAAKSTFLKVVDVGIPYAPSTSSGNAFYRYVLGFVEDDVRVVFFRPNPGKIQIYRYDATGATLNGYPLNSNQPQIQDSFNIEFDSDNQGLFVKVRARMNSAYIFDSCNHHSTSIWSQNTNLFRIDQNDIIVRKDQSFNPYFGELAYGDILETRILRNGNVAYLDHLINYYYDNNSQRDVYETDILLSEYTKDLNLVGIHKYDFYSDDLVYELIENNDNYIIQGFSGACFNYTQEYSYFSKSNFLFSFMINYSDASDYIKNLPYLRNLDQNFSASLSTETFGDQSNRLKLTLYNKNTETVLGGYPIFMSPPAGYSNINWGGIIKDGNTFNIACKLKVNPNSTVSDLCLLKMTDTGQILDTDIYGAAQGVEPGQSGDVNLKKMANGDFLIYLFVPETGKLTLLRVDKDGNL